MSVHVPSQKIKEERLLCGEEVMSAAVWGYVYFYKVCRRVSLVAVRV